MKPITNSEYNKSINLAVDYINQHLHESIDLITIAKIANISEYHFHRIFKAYIGETIGAYTSRLRLEKAAQKLQTTRQTLTEIAEKTGYQSQYSLSKAFKNHFGISPTAFRNLETYFTERFVKPEHKAIELNPKIYELVTGE